MSEFSYIFLKFLQCRVTSEFDSSKMIKNEWDEI